jgi:hypothetical protein
MYKGDRFFWGGPPEPGVASGWRRAESEGARGKELYIYDTLDRSHQPFAGQGHRLCVFFWTCGKPAPAAETALMGMLELKPGNPDYLS